MKFIELSLEEVNRIFTEKGCILSEYTGSQNKVTYVASCGHVNTLTDLYSFKRGNGVCTECIKHLAAIKMVEDKKEELRTTLAGFGCTLLDYKGWDKPTTYIGTCGHTVSKQLKSFSSEDALCASCRLEKRSNDLLLDFAKTEGIQVFSISSDSITFGCKHCGSPLTSVKGNFKKHKRVCSTCRSSTIKENFLPTIKERVESKGCKFLGTTAANIHFIGTCGHEDTSSNIHNFDKISGLCKECSRQQADLAHRRPVAEIEEIASTKGVTLINYTTTKAPITFMGTCGHVGTLVGIQQFKASNGVCKECNINERKLTQEEVEKRFEELGVKLLSTYVDANTNIEFLTRCGCTTKTAKPYTVWQGIGLDCTRCSSGTSKAEQEIRDFVSQYTEVKDRQRVLGGQEVDILLPAYNLGIEYNGLYWHSETAGKARGYHLSKTNKAKELGLDLIHVFEDEWTNKKDIIKSILLSKLGITTKIYGRKTTIKEVSSKESFAFLEENHRQGGVHGSYRLGLYYGDNLVALMVFGKARFSDADYELLRYCSLMNTTVVGGASKLLKYFRTTVQGSIVTYADRRYSNGALYESLGFTKVSVSAPNYWYFQKGTINLESRVKYQKHKLPNILSEFSSDKTEYQNMLDNGYLRIWDCGNIVYKLQ